MKQTQGAAARGDLDDDDAGSPPSGEMAASGGPSDGTGIVEFNYKPAVLKAFMERDKSVRDEVVSQAVRAIMLLGMSDARIVSRAAVRKCMDGDEKQKYARQCLRCCAGCAARLFVDFELVDFARRLVALSLAQQRIKEVFGMELRCLEKAPKDTSKKSEEVKVDNTTFMLVNTLMHPDHLRCVVLWLLPRWFCQAAAVFPCVVWFTCSDLSDSTSAEARGFIMTVVSLIFLHRVAPITLRACCCRGVNVHCAVWSCTPCRLRWCRHVRARRASLSGSLFPQQSSWSSSRRWTPTRKPSSTVASKQRLRSCWLRSALLCRAGAPAPCASHCIPSASLRCGPLQVFEESGGLQA